MTNKTEKQFLYDMLSKRNDSNIELEDNIVYDWDNSIRYDFDSNGDFIISYRI